MLTTRQTFALIAISVCGLMSGCITQLVTTPAQAASQTAQTAGQIVTPYSDTTSLLDSGSDYQSSAYSNLNDAPMTTEASSVKKAQRNNL